MSNRFIPFKTEDSSDMAQDSASKLIWSKTLNDDSLNHADCVKLVEDLESREKQGWRMPTIQELLTLVDYEKRDPAIDTDAFPDTKSDWYWSASSVAGYPGGAWSVHFYYGLSGWFSRGYLGFVRAVRPSQ